MYTMLLEEKKIFENYIYNLCKNAYKNINEDRYSQGEKNDNDKSNKETKNKRRIVTNWLKKNTINNAAVMKALWHPTKQDEDAKRSYFYKCRDGELNDDGTPYQFSDDDITTLYRIKSSGEM